MTEVEKTRIEYERRSSQQDEQIRLLETKQETFNAQVTLHNWFCFINRLFYMLTTFIKLLTILNIVVQLIIIAEYIDLIMICFALCRSKKKKKKVQSLFMS